MQSEILTQSHRSGAAPPYVESDVPADDTLPQTTMRVTKRNGSTEPVDVNKIVRAVNRCCAGLPDVDALRVATKTISGLYDGATTRELDQLSIQTAAALIVEEPQYTRLAARLLATYIDKEVQNQEIYAFSQSVAEGRRLGLINDRLQGFVAENARKLNDALLPERDREFEYFGLRTLYDRYLLKHPETRLVIETPQHFFLRIACALSETVPEALELYRLFSSLEYLPSSPTLFNAGTRHEQLSSCFLLDSPAGPARGHLRALHRRRDALEVLRRHRPRLPPRALARLADREHQRPLERHRSVAQDPRRVGGRGQSGRQAQGRVLRLPRALARRHRGVPRAARQHRRRGQPHPQPESRQLDPRPLHATRRVGRGLEPVRPQGRARAPRPLRRRVRASLRSRGACRPGCQDDQGARPLRAHDADARPDRQRLDDFQGQVATAPATRPRCPAASCTSRTCAPRSSRSRPATRPRSATSARSTSRVTPRGTRTEPSRSTSTSSPAPSRTAVRQLDRVIDLNFYPIPSTRSSNLRWRPVGLGLMGLQDVFFQMRLPFDAPEARALSRRISEEIYFHALSASADLAGRERPAPRLRGDPRRARRAPVRRLGRGSGPSRALGRLARAHPRAWPAQLPARRHRAHGDHRLDRRLLRVHRAAGLEPVQARDPVRRLPAGEPLPGRGAEGARPVDRGRPHPAQARRGLRAGAGGAARRSPRRLPDRLGDPHALADRHGRRARRLHRSEPVAEPVHREPEHRPALVHVLLRLEAGPQDHLLPALAPGHAHRQGHGRTLRRPRSPARSRTPRPARHANESRPAPCAPARSRPVPDAPAHGISALLRDVPRRHQEHLDRRGGRLLHRHRRSARPA